MSYSDLLWQRHFGGPLNYCTFSISNLRDTKQSFN